MELLGFLAIVGTGFLAGYWEGNKEIEQLQVEALQRGFAEYNSTNGQWQWKESK